LKLKLEPPPDRTADQLEHHFQVERAIATRLLRADRSERTNLYRSMYDELFAQVPDHPRLTRRRNETATAAVNLERVKLLRRFLHPGAAVVEFGPGDCRLAFELCRYARSVCGVDISDQRGSSHEEPPANFTHVVYDGYHVPLDEQSADVVFSDQLIEHLHPLDTAHHFGLVHRLLKDGGVYVFRTPHRLTGPHDVSRYFGDEPRGFHLREWSYAELTGVLRDAGYRSWRALYGVKGRHVLVPACCLAAAESLLRACPRGLGRGLARLLFRGGVCMVAYR
jgi:SAM-dependent methyltransferase